MDKNTRYSLIAVAVLLLASAGVATLLSVEASSNNEMAPVVLSSNDDDRTPLKQGWNTITAKWDFVLKTAEIKQNGASNIIPVAKSLNVISDKIINVQDGRTLGNENTIQQGQQIEVYLNKANSSDSPAIILKK